MGELLEPFSTHALFYIPEAVTVQATEPSFAQLLSQFELTGIIQGAEPEALIQNRSSKQTYFIQPGEQFEQFKLVEIKEHSVVVESGGKQQEMPIST